MVEKLTERTQDAAVCTPARVILQHTVKKQISTAHYHASPHCLELPKKGLEQEWARQYSERNQTPYSSLSSPSHQPRLGPHVHSHSGSHFLIQCGWALPGTKAENMQPVALD